MSNEKLDKFKSEFKISEHGFYDITSYSDGSIGFSVRKRFKKDDKNVSQLSVYVQESVSGNLKPIIVHATYGEATKDGIRIRSKHKLLDPVDLESGDEYYYDISKNKFFKKNKEVSADKIVEEIYKKHIKSTKFFRGFWIRMKMFFWIILLKSLFEYISKLFHFLLYLVSGARYSYNYFFDQIIKADENYPQIGKDKGKENSKEGEKINLFGYQASRWAVMFYSVFHMSIYFAWMYFNYKPVIIVAIFKNTFLIVIYVILSLGFIDAVIPVLFEFLIRLFSKLSFKSQHKTIKI